MSYCGVACGQFPFFLRPQGANRALPGEGSVTGAARQHDPQHFPDVRTGPAPFYTSDPHGCAQQSLQHVLVPGWQAALQRAGACARRPAPRTRIWPGPGLDGIAHDGGHRMLAARPAGQAARVPRRLPAVTLTVILPAARPRYAQAARAPPPALFPRLRDHGHEPEQEAPVPIDDRVQQLITGRQRPVPGRRPSGGVSARDGAAPSLAGSHSGGHARACCRRGGTRAYRLRPGAAARGPRPCSAGPQIIAAGIPAVAGMPTLARRSCGQNQARPLHV